MLQILKICAQSGASSHAMAHKVMQVSRKYLIWRATSCAFRILSTVQVVDRLIHNFVCRKLSVLAESDTCERTVCSHECEWQTRLRGTGNRTRPSVCVIPLAYVSLAAYIQIQREEKEFLCVILIFSSVRRTSSFTLPSIAVYFSWLEEATPSMLSKYSELAWLQEPVEAHRVSNIIYILRTVHKPTVQCLSQPCHKDDVKCLS